MGANGILDACAVVDLELCVQKAGGVRVCFAFECTKKKEQDLYLILSLLPRHFHIPFLLFTDFLPRRFQSDVFG